MIKISRDDNGHRITIEAEGAEARMSLYCNSRTAPMDDDADEIAQGEAARERLRRRPTLRYRCEGCEWEGTYEELELEVDELGLPTLEHCPECLSDEVDLVP